MGEPVVAARVSSKKSSGDVATLATNILIVVVTTQPAQHKSGKMIKNTRLTYLAARR